MPNKIGPVSAVRPVSAKTPTETGFAAGKPAASAAEAPGLRIETSALASSPPINAERVAQIRNAIAEGSYPLLPAKIADEMIAAGLRLSLGE